MRLSKLKFRCCFKKQQKELIKFDRRLIDNKGQNNRDLIPELPVVTLPSWDVGKLYKVQKKVNPQIVLFWHFFFFLPLLLVLI